MSALKRDIMELLFVLLLSTAAQGIYVPVAHFGTFGQGMLVNWKYPVPASGHGSQALDFHDGPDIPLHIRPYYGSNHVAMNTYISRRWGTQEQPRNFPFRRGVLNDVTVYTRASGFDIYANRGAFHYRYNYRTDVTQIKALYYGYSDTHFTSIGKVLPTFGFGKVVYISGKAPNTCTNFTIDLVQSQASSYSDDTIHLRLKVQLEQPQVVVRNTYSGSRWGVEERSGGMPFSPGQPFTVTVVAQLFGFEVAVNGNHFTHYRYRLPLASQMVVMLTNVPYIQKIEYF